MSEEGIEKDRMKEDGMKKDKMMEGDRTREGKIKETWTDQRLSQEITKALDHLEATVPPPLPYLAEIETLVARVEENKSSRARKRTLVFMAVAVLLASAEALAFSYSAEIFIAVQVLAVLAPVTALIVKHIAKRQATAE